MQVGGNSKPVGWCGTLPPKAKQPGECGTPAPSKKPEGRKPDGWCGTVPPAPKKEVCLFPSLVDSESSRNANVKNVQLFEGFGAVSSKLLVDFVANDSAHQLVHETKQGRGSISVRVADYRDPNEFGLHVIRVEQKEIDLPRASAGTKVSVVNRDGSPLFEDTLKFNPV